MIRFYRLLGVFLLVLLWRSDALALSSNWQRDGAVDARLISAYEGVGQKKVIPLGLEVRMEPGWHTYWRSPGGVGLPPDINWSKSETDAGNLKSATLYYPAPKRYLTNDLETIGYNSRVVFPIDAELRKVGEPLNLDATVTLLVCSLQCVPKTFNFQLSLSKDKAVEGSEADVLAPWRAKVPGRDAAKAGLYVEDFRVDGKNYVIGIKSDTALTAPDLFIETEKETAFLAPKVKLSDDARSAVLTLSPADPTQNLGGADGASAVLTVVDGDRSVEIVTTLPDQHGPVEKHAMALRTALWLAFLGGFILNFMPCVLPVLSLKVLGVISHGGKAAHHARRSFLTSAAGILFSFIVLGAITASLRGVGMNFGWGVQFQQPVFLVLLIGLLSFFAANLWGLFEIRLPRYMMDKVGGHHPKLAGDFAAGALATLLATPCTAPFLGTAVGFALAAGTKEIMAIFVMLGVGMTVPYLIFAFIPELATALPKPGRWMAKLRVMLGFALAFTALWLLWVLSAQIAMPNVVIVGVCMVGMIALLGIPAKRLMRALMGAGIFFFAVVALTQALSGTPQMQAKQQEDMPWQPFNEASITYQVQAGHTVFVDITAAWCLTCKANKQFVLSDQVLTDKLFRSDVIAMQGDWTNPDPKIASFLKRFGRYGIPFNVVFGPGAPDGITLPELLTRESVLEAIERASGH